jgi:hypothetical protein
VDDPGPGRSVWFVGDLDDPWVAAIADALPPTTLRFAAAGDLPETLLDVAEPPSTLVLHRAVLTRHDFERLRRLRARRTTRVVLCLGPHTRHHDLEQWSELVDVAISEATANETIARRLVPSAEGLRTLSPLRPRPRIAIVSTNTALRDAVAEACEAAGYPAAMARAFEDAPPGGPSVWDVPVLEAEWPEAIALRARVGPVVALLGFADRGLVTQARSAGASACLELPFDVQDLAGALDRVTAPRVRAMHEVPPAPHGLKRHPARQPVAEPGHEA